MTPAPRVLEMAGWGVAGLDGMEVVESGWVACCCLLFSLRE